MRPNGRIRNARVIFDLGAEGTWGFMLHDGVAAVTAHTLRDPDTVITTNAKTLADIYLGRRPGYDAFLAGELAVRGNLSLALELESMFTPVETPPEGWPETIRVRAGKVGWSILSAGPPSAPPVLLLHGLGSTKTSLLPTVSALSDEFRVYACDLPGFGDSDKPMGQYDARWFAARVIDLLEAMDIKQAGLVGNSMGGRIALEMALAYPDRVRAAVLLCPALAFRRFRQAAFLVRLLRPELSSIVALRPRRSLLLGVMHRIFVHPEQIPEVWFQAAADEFLRVYRSPRARMALAAASRHIYLDEPHGEAGLWSRLRRLDVPTQFIFGRQDPLISPAFARHVREAAPHARVDIFEDCGHVPQFEQPERTHELARKLLAG